MFKCLQNRGHECTSEDFSEVATGRWQLPSLGPFFFSSCWQPRRSWSDRDRLQRRRHEGIASDVRKLCSEK